MQDESAEVIGSEVDDQAKIYRFVRIDRSIVGANSVVGDWSRLTESTIEDSVRIDRSNHLHRVSMGRFSYTGPHTVVMESQIGRFCSISWNVTIGPGDHDYQRCTTHSFLYNSQVSIGDGEPLYDRFARPCEVGHDVWIGCGAVVLRGVKVGHGSVIGANAVVTHDVPPYAIVLGNPARLLKYRFDVETIDAFLDLAWWDWPQDVIRASRELLGSYPNRDLLGRLREKKGEIGNRGSSRTWKL